ncbi:MAG: DUF2255 family protein [Candidatus Limnocylindrales bacterium]|jgi:hypothetical protein
MATWTRDEVARIGAAAILYIAARSADGTLRNSVPIWAVAHDGRLYVRSVNGRDAAWFRGTQATHEGHIRAGGVDKDVTFVDVPNDINDALDAAYRAKYRNSTGIDHIQRPQARSATLELVPR